MPRLIEVLATLFCIGAGIYLLQYGWDGTAEDGTSWFEIIGHGMGLYFIGKGLFIGRSLHLQAEARDRLTQLVEIAAQTHTRESGTEQQR